MAEIYENFKELIELLPEIRRAVQKGIIKDTKDHVHDASRIKKERRFLRLGLDVLQRKWAIEIIYALYNLGEPSFNDIKRALLGISSRTLIERLRSLMDSDLVHRRVQATSPPRVNYKLSDFGKGAYELLIPCLFYFILPRKFRK